MDGKPLHYHTRKTTRGTLLMMTIFLAAGMAAHLQQVHGQNHQPILTMRVPFQPEPVLLSSKQWVYYELQLINVGKDTVEINSVTVTDINNKVDVTMLTGAGLVHQSGASNTTQKNTSRIAPGDSNVVYLEYPLPAGTHTAGLVHRVKFVTDVGDTTIVLGAGLQISLKQPLVLGAPLGKGYWAAVYDPAWQRGHRRVYYEEDGRSRIPGRFAIDFIKLDSQGLYAKGDENEIKNWYGYGVDVLAVHDGVVRSVLNDFPESATLSAHPDHPSAKATGNYLTIDIGNNRIIFYEHLQPGSIRVKPGQKVKKGMVIASLGFTGQTTGPHLHFHVANRNAPLGAEGISFVFERFAYAGSYTDFEKFGKKPWDCPGPQSGKMIRQERPAPNSVVLFSPD